MLQRCDNGLQVLWREGLVKRWRGSTGFDKFVVDMGERPDGLTLDRIRSNRWYSKELSLGFNEDAVHKPQSY
jgi:hypothetical protein